MGFGEYLPRGMFRSRALLDKAHKFERCTNCQRETPEGCEPAHSDASEHGKAKGLKPHDCFFAALCWQCHRWYDNQGGHGQDPSRRFQYSEKEQMFAKAKDATLLHCFLMGWLLVVP